MASRQLLLVAKETTYADPAQALVAADAVWAEAVAYTIRGERIVSDPARPSSGAVPGYVVGEHVEVAFEVQLAGSGVVATAPKFGKLLKACGMSETITPTTSVSYNLVHDTSAADSLSMVWRDAGRLHRIRGARGRWGFKLVAGQQPKLTFVFRGLYSPVEAGAPLVSADAVFTGWKEALVINQANVGFEMDGAALGLRDASFDSADNVRFVDLPGQKDVRIVGDRAMTGAIKATMPAVGVFNGEAKWRGNARILFSAQIGNLAGSICSVSGGVQFTAPPAYSRDNEQDVFSAAAQFLPSTNSALDDVGMIFL